MTNFVRDAAMDAAFDTGANAATTLHVCSGNPLDRATVLANSLGSVAIDNTAFTKADGDTSGRKVTIAQQSIASASAPGTAHVVAVVDGSDLLTAADLTQEPAGTTG